MTVDPTDYSADDLTYGEMGYESSVCDARLRTRGQALAAWVEETGYDWCDGRAFKRHVIAMTPDEQWEELRSSDSESHLPEQRPDDWDNYEDLNSYRFAPKNTTGTTSVWIVCHRNDGVPPVLENEMLPLIR